jgi:ERF superfamily
MGAALTYARRYALFALVGIDGEDDLDAPDLDAPEPARPDTNNGSRGAQKYWPQKKTQAKLAPDEDSNSANSRLKAQLSAVLRDQLMSELKGMQTAEDAAVWARRILPAKSADARQVEDAFQAKLAIMEGATEAHDGHAPVVMSGSNTQPAEGSIRKWPARIDKSHLPYPEPRRIRDRDHVRFVAKQPCLICARRPADPHHLRFVQHRALGRKVSDEFTCRCAAGITVRSIALATKPYGGQKPALIRLSLPVRFGWRRTRCRQVADRIESKKRELADRKSLEG